MQAAAQPEERRHTGRRLVWLVGAAVGSLALGATVSVVEFSLSGSRAIRARYEMIEVGMGEGRVEDLLGNTPGDYRGKGGAFRLSRQIGPARLPRPFRISMLCRRPESWYFDDYTITVEFHMCAVCEKAIEPVPGTLADRLKSLLEHTWP